jgi:hypothetical protein
MEQTYPETNTFRWEGDTVYPVPEAVGLLLDMASQGKSTPRQRALRATAQALEAISEAKDKPYFTGDQIKKVLIAAAQEHGWWARKARVIPDLTAPEGMKVCFRCTKAKEIDDFKTAPSPAKVRRYGWSESTTQKVIGPLCASCRKAKAAEQSKKRTRRVSRTKIDKFSSPDAAVLKQYQKIKLQIADHMNRVRAAFTNAKAVVKDPFGDGTDLVEYQFRDDDTRDFYHMKRALLLDARDRLEQRLSDAVPLPDTWGMLLTTTEQNNLATLHSHVVSGRHANHIPALWRLAERKPKEHEE